MDKGGDGKRREPGTADMRTYILIACLFFSCLASAEDILVYHWNENTRVILTVNDCPPMEGSKVAVVQTKPENKLQFGCYVYDKEKGVVHIQWSADPMNYDELNVEGFAPENMIAEEDRGI